MADQVSGKKVQNRWWWHTSIINLYLLYIFDKGFAFVPSKAYSGTTIMPLRQGKHRSGK